MSLPNLQTEPMLTPPGRLIRGPFNDVRQLATDATGGIRPPVPPTRRTDTQTFTAASDAMTAAEFAAVIDTLDGQPRRGRHRAPTPARTRRSRLAAWWASYRAEVFRRPRLRRPERWGEHGWWNGFARGDLLAEVITMTVISGLAIYGVVSMWIYLTGRS